MKWYSLTRRKFFFLGAGLAVGAGAWMLGRRPVKLGLIGAGIQGQALAKAVSTGWWFGGSCGSIVAVCDVDSARSEEARKKWCPSAEHYGAHERLLERDDVEAVMVATPDHWHARIAHDAMKAGKAVYCEKPIGLTIAEGRALARAVEETGTVFQGGTLQRTSLRFNQAVGLVRQGRLGKVHSITVTLPTRWVGESQGPFPACAPPATLDWERWLGQAPLVPYCPQRCHGSFRRWFEYSGGQLTDWGAHHLDIVHWALDLRDGGPTSVRAEGEMPNIPDGYSTPLKFTADLEFPGGVEVRIRTDPEYANNGLRFEGEDGWFFVNRERMEGPAAEELKKKPLKMPGGAWGSGWSSNVLIHHVARFLARVKANGAGEATSDAEGMHRSATSCHLANIALRTGRRIAWDAASERIVGDARAEAMLTRPQRRGYESEPAGLARRS
ncbi:MAG: Gfo/Idh/MocA family oxidoreductase [Gemmataceae bacterium]|nr:Gfo/Idh/MocA family oxidoreductase [Gemmataceae bacterium]